MESFKEMKALRQHEPKNVMIVSIKNSSSLVKKNKRLHAPTELQNLRETQLKTIHLLFRYFPLNAKYPHNIHPNITASL